MTSAGQLPFFLVDAFTWEAFAGNPAGVVFDADGLTDAQMQTIAREVNACETTFVLRPSAPGAVCGFRWLTPATEVEFCGHATLGGIHALLESGRIPRASGEPDVILSIQTRFRGVIAVRADPPSASSRAGLVWFDAPDLTIQPSDVPLPRLAEALGADASIFDPAIPVVTTVDRDVIAAVRDTETLLGLRPRMDDIIELGARIRMRGLLVTTQHTGSRTVAARSRFFAPAAGIPEDPVTGSVHGPLGLHLVHSGVVSLIDGRATFECTQSQVGGRSGIIRVTVTQQDGTDFRVRVGGACATTIRGTIAIPAA